MVSGYHRVLKHFMPAKSWWMENHIHHAVLQVKYFYNLQPNGREIELCKLQRKAEQGGLTPKAVCLY